MNTKKVDEILNHLDSTKIRCDCGHWANINDVDSYILNERNK